MTDAPRPPSHFERIGGLKTLAAFVKRYYAVMDKDRDAARKRRCHGDDLPRCHQGRPGQRC